jgi:hypothetical protein
MANFWLNNPTESRATGLDGTKTGSAGGRNLDRCDKEARAHTSRHLDRLKEMAMLQATGPIYK